MNRPGMPTSAARAAARPADGELLADGDDLEQARALVSGIFVEHRVRGLEAAASRPINIRYCQLDSVALCHFDYGRGVEIHPDPFEEFYLLLAPLSGAAQIRSGAAHHVGSVGSALVLPADEEVSMLWSQQTRKLVLQINRRKLTEKLEAHLGRSLPRSPRFDLAARDLGSETPLVRHAIDGLCALSLMPRGPGRDLMCAAHEDALYTSLLWSHPSDYSAAIRDGAISSACPRSVRRAEAYIEAHLSEPFSIDDVARAAEVSTRALFESFRQFRDLSPMKYVRFRRLQAARDILRRSGPEERVADVAARLGFGHLGRFASDYARRFGETPSETLRKANS
ncbi:AraC family transcriptional regulator [Salipiger pacificus]|nr:AraC family transcriptional regulator [Alloyangia pacifica]MCA0945010.1 AraC family transcriptional regulator [Alloyangia pacifica]